MYIIKVSDKYYVNTVDNSVDIIEKMVVDYKEDLNKILVQLDKNFSSTKKKVIDDDGLPLWENLEDKVDTSSIILDDFNCVSSDKVMEKYSIELKFQLLNVQTIVEDLKKIEYKEILQNAHWYGFDYKEYLEKELAKFGWTKAIYTEYE